MFGRFVRLMIRVTTLNIIRQLLLRRRPSGYSRRFVRTGPLLSIVQKSSIRGLDDWKLRAILIFHRSMIFCALCTEQQASAVFAKVRAGVSATTEETEKFASYLLLFLGRLDAEKGWTKQLHLGALRSVNTRRTRKLGTDKGFDGIGDWNQIEALCSFLDKLDQEHALP